MNAIKAIVVTNRARIGIVLLALLGAGVLTRITDHARVKADPVPMVTGMAEGQLDIVDPATGNLHLTIPLVATTKPSH
jgi:hypothetical protein